MRNILLSIFAIVFFVSCVSVELPQNRTVVESSGSDLKSKLHIYPTEGIPYQEVANESITNVKEGDTNLYGIKITKELKVAYDGYLNGDGDKALSALAQISKTSDDPKMLWQASFLKIQTLIMMGLSDDALEEVNICTKYEKQSFNSDLNCIALRGELNVWLEDYEAAKKDASSVLLTIGSWEFPTDYPAPPSNMDTLVATTTAQMRAYTTLAALNNLSENYKESYYWANEAEKRMNAVHYVSNHWLYGKFVNLHLDSYYGRATNLTFLATAKLALGYDQKEVDKDFERAVKFFEMIDYKKGIATVLALKARVYNKTGQHDKCYAEGKKALDYAVRHGFLDFVWRIEAIRADTFMHLGYKEDAKRAYRRANDTINTLTGALSSDSAKVRFGIGKDDITYNLIKFDIEDNDLAQLFSDMETNRARAFVDMLSTRAVNLNRDNKHLKDIQALDLTIKRQQLLNTAPGDNTKGIEKLNKMFKLRAAKEALLQKEDSALASTVSIWSNSLENTKKNLNENEKIVYFLPLKPKDKLRYLEITKDDAKLHTLNITTGELAHQLSNLSDMLGLNTLLSTRGLTKKNSSLVSGMSIKEPKNIDKMAAYLNEQLQSVKLFNKTKTYIVSSGITNFIPWGMLATNKEFATLPNGSWLTYKDTKQKFEDNIVVLGNPNFNGELPQLEGAEIEAKEVAKEYGVEPLLSFEATKENLKGYTEQGVNILHLATHGIFYKDKPLESAVILSDAEPMSAKEIYEEPLKANLVVLSACETGLGRSSSGDDLLGLQRSFFLGGTKTILSSFWEIDDKGTKEFMTEFHKYAKRGEYSKGYLKARQSLKEKGYSPAIYGAFILNGLDR